MNDRIKIDENLKKIPMLYIENDSSLRDIDRDCIENTLGGRGFADIKDFNIDYHFDAYVDIAGTFEKVKSAKYILINSSFTGVSLDLLYQLIKGASKLNIRDKIILNCCSLSVCNLYGLISISDELKALENERNIKFFFPEVDYFVKLDPDRLRFSKNLI